MATGKRFSQFLTNIALTDAQKMAGNTNRESVVSTLNWSYYSTNNKTQNSQFVGSWGKYTRVRPPRDVDILYTLPPSVYERFQARQGNKQSQLLQEVKSILAAQFGSTSIKGSGPVVIVPFAAYAVELIPAFKLNTGQFYICMTDSGGHYKNAAYDAEAATISASNAASKDNTRDLIRMMKRWQAYCNVPIKSFYIELLAVEFLASWSYKGQSSVYYDYMVRDFLKHMLGKSGGYIYAPGTYEQMSLGSAWKAKADSALVSAELACAEEAKSNWGMAGAYWQQIFSDDIPRNP